MQNVAELRLGTIRDELLDNCRTADSSCVLEQRWLSGRQKGTVALVTQAAVASIFSTDIWIGAILEEQV